MLLLLKVQETRMPRRYLKKKSIKIEEQEELANVDDDEENVNEGNNYER